MNHNATAKTKVVVVGAGAMGQIVIRDLLEFASDKMSLLVADYDVQAAQHYVSQFPQHDLQVAQIDARNIDDTASRIMGAEVIINCAQYQLNLELMQAALKVKAHYIDLGGLFHFTRKQMELDSQFKLIDRSAIIGMGAAPGITNILARYSADSLDKVYEIHARLAMKDLTRYSYLPALPVSYSLQTILEEFSYPPAVFSKGKFRFVEPMSGNQPHPFPQPVGVQRPMFTIHSEVATLPLSFQAKGVREVSFKIAFDEQFVEKVRFLRDFGLASEKPVELQGTSVVPIQFINKMARLQQPPKPKTKIKQHEVVRVIVKGIKKKKKVTHIVDCHTQGLPEWGFGTDVNTGCPPAIAAIMLSRGEVKQSGVVPPETAIDPKRFLQELKKRKMWVEEILKNSWTFPT